MQVVRACAWMTLCSGCCSPNLLVTNRMNGARASMQIVLFLSDFGNPAVEFKITRLLPLMASGAFIVSERMGLDTVGWGWWHTCEHV
jgi:hypothetical protein